MRVSFSATTGVLSALALLLIKETVFFLSEYRQASEQQELVHKCACPTVWNLRLVEASVSLWIWHGLACRFRLSVHFPC